MRGPVTPMLAAMMAIHMPAAVTAPAMVRLGPRLAMPRNRPHPDKRDGNYQRNEELQYQNPLHTVLDGQNDGSTTRIFAQEVLKKAKLGAHFSANAHIPSGALART